MTTTNAPFLRLQREFPDDDIQSLTIQVNRAYVDTAVAMNQRVVGLFPLNVPIANGETWNLLGTSNRNQGLRQVFAFTGAGSIAHGITWSGLSFVSPRSYGTYTDGANWYGAIYASSTAITGQVSFYVTSTDIVVLVDGAAPSVTSGLIVLEWTSVP